MIYLDHASATPILPDALEELNSSLVHDWANSSAKHKLGKLQAQELERCRKIVANSISAKPEQIIFLSSVTEANNLFATQLTIGGIEDKIFSLADHSSIVKVLAQYPQRAIALEQWKQQKLNKAMFFWSAVNSQSGLRENCEQLVQDIRERVPNSLIGVDASQFYLRYPLNVISLDIDFISLSSHKLGGPKGIAACYIKHPEQVKPLLVGGGHEFALRASSVAIPLIKAFVKVVELWEQSASEWMGHIAELNSLFVELVQKQEPEIIFPYLHHSTAANILMVIFPQVQSDILMRHLEMDEIFVASSSACGSKSKVNSEMFFTLGVDEKYHKNILRFSFAPSTTKREIEIAVSKLLGHYKMLRKLKGR